MRSVMPIPPAEFSPLTIDQVGRVALAQRRHRLAQPAPPGAADHVADEEDSHRALTLSARLSAMADRGARRQRDLERAALAYPYAAPRGAPSSSSASGAARAAAGGARTSAAARRCSPTAPTPRREALARKLAALPGAAAAGAARRAGRLRRRLLRPRLSLRRGAGDAHRAARARPRPVYVALPDRRAAARCSPRPSRTTSWPARPSRRPSRSGGRAGEVDAFVSRHGCLPLDGSPVALAAIALGGAHASPSSTSRRSSSASAPASSPELEPRAASSVRLHRAAAGQRRFHGSRSL